MTYLFAFWNYLRTHKRYWLTPIAVLLLMLGGLVLFTQATVFSQFLYPDF